MKPVCHRLSLCDPDHCLSGSNIVSDLEPLLLEPFCFLSASRAALYSLGWNILHLSIARTSAGRSSSTMSQHVLVVPALPPADLTLLGHRDLRFLGHCGFAFLDSFLLRGGICTGCHFYLIILKLSAS